MEDGRIYPLNEYSSQAHKFETPQPLLQTLRDSAEKIGDPKEKDLIKNLVDLKQNVFIFMNHFNLEMRDFESEMRGKKFKNGGFTKRAVQKHPFLGEKGLRLVRDKLSDNVFLKKEEKDLYIRLLKRKLLEEVVELTEATCRKERKDELGDVFEVFDTLLGAEGISSALIEDNRKSIEIKAAKERRKLARKK